MYRIHRCASLLKMTRLRKTITAISIAGIAAGSLFVASPAQAESNSNSVRGAYNTWVSALEQANCKGKKVSSLYTKDGILLATFTDEVVGKKAITKYFDGLTCNDDLDVTTQSFDSNRDADMAWATGLYTFSFTGADGETVTAPARYTFVFEKTRGGWKIVNHHSSVRPEGN